MTRTPSELLDALYRDADGLISMCSHCRRVQRAERGESPWDWVPSYVAHIPQQTSHGLCPLCAPFFFSR